MLDPGTEDDDTTSTRNQMNDKAYYEMSSTASHPALHCSLLSSSLDSLKSKTSLVSLLQRPQSSSEISPLQNDQEQ